VSDQLSVIHLVSEASLVVQLVMLSLVLASVTSWVMIFQRSFFLRRVERDLNDFEDHFWSGIDLRELHDELEAEATLTGIENVFVSGFKEYSRLSETTRNEPDAIMQGVQRAMRIALTREGERLETHLAFLATVGSTSPYVGLFGTVWGIMHAFTGLASMQQVTLATVAPGIAEALVATAIGLFSAIPAVVAYNRFARDIDRVAIKLETFIEEFSNILQRSLGGSTGASGSMPTGAGLSASGH